MTLEELITKVSELENQVKVLNGVISEHERRIRELEKQEQA